MKALVLFEGPEWRALRPLTDLIATPALAFGASNLATRWQAATALPLLAIEARANVLATWHGRPPATAVVGPDDEILVIDAAALPGAWLDAVRAHAGPALFRAKPAKGRERVVAARLPYSRLASGIGRGDAFAGHLIGLGLPEVPGTDAKFLTYPWDLIEGNVAAIEQDLASAPASREGSVHPQAVLYEPHRISVAAGARVDALAVLDARGGPIRIGANAIVLANTVVAGPCVVGEGTQLLGGFVGRSTFGPDCRIAGEVDECVWQGYGNKRHHGFLGHSALGEWVNLGALTTTSDLKNNYGHIRVWLDGTEIDTHSSKVGSIVGSHVKMGIGTLLPTGASIGTGANLFGGGHFAPKYVASFAWWDGARGVEYELERFLATARVAMARRSRRLDAADETLLRETFAETGRERKSSPES